MKSHQMSFFQFYRFIYHYLKPYKFLFVQFLVVNLIQTAFFIVIPLSYMEIFNHIILQHSSEVINLQPLTDLTILLSIALVLGFFAMYFTELLIAKLAWLILSDLRYDMIKHFNQLPLIYIYNTEKGKFTSCFSSELVSIEYALTEFTSLAIQLIFLSVSSLIVIFYLEWRLGVMIVVLFAFLFLVSRVITSYAHEANFEKKHLDANFVALVNEISISQMIIRAYSLQKFWLNVARDRLTTLIKFTSISNLFNALSSTLIVAGSFIIEIAMIIYGAYLAIHQQVTPGVLVALLAFIAYLLGSLQVLGYDYATLNSALGALRRIKKVILDQPIMAQQGHMKSLPPLEEGIQIKNLSFQYHPNSRILKNISMNIPIGEFTAIVGPNGSGKSTLLALLLGLYTNYEGEILLDNHEIRSINENSLRDQIGIVLQDSMLFNFSIYDNIRMGKLDATEEEIYAVAIQVGLGSLINNLTLKVGELGSMLSGGQRQRIAIARALIRNPRILFLDEITSALDPESELEINDIIQKLSKECTIVFITHRLYSIMNAKQILVLNEGELVETGNHQTLLEKNGIYANMWHGQQKYFTQILNNPFKGSS